MRLGWLLKPKTGFVIKKVKRFHSDTKPTDAINFASWTSSFCHSSALTHALALSLCLSIGVKWWVAIGQSFHFVLAKNLAQTCFHSLSKFLVFISFCWSISWHAQAPARITVPSNVKIFSFEAFLYYCVWSWMARVSVCVQGKIYKGCKRKIIKSESSVLSFRRFSQALDERKLFFANSSSEVQLNLSQNSLKTTKSVLCATEVLFSVWQK